MWFGGQDPDEVSGLGIFPVGRTAPWVPQPPPVIFFPAMGLSSPPTGPTPGSVHDVSPPSERQEDPYTRVTSDTRRHQPPPPNKREVRRDATPTKDKR